MRFEQFKKIFAIVTESYRQSLSPLMYSESDSGDTVAVAKLLNDSFIIALACDEADEIREMAVRFLEKIQADKDWGISAGFYLDGLSLVRNEIDRLADMPGFRDRFALAEEIISGLNVQQALHFNNEESIAMVESIWKLFFPEGVGIMVKAQEEENRLREKRKITGISLNPSPITDPVRQLLLTSNVLLTVPRCRKSIDSMEMKDFLKQKIISAMDEPQANWYDHPIPLDVKNDANEVVYGLRGLRDMLKFEQSRGNADKAQNLKCALSVSVTHPGIAPIAREYLRHELERAGGAEGLDVFIFTECDTAMILEEVLKPLAERYMSDDNRFEALAEVLGVDGAYGRHYSFLKAISAFWHVLIDSNIEATFKIDLDQVFPQEVLVNEGGGSAFDHFKSRLWGATGHDDDGNYVELGMIAGSLVNEKDIEKSLYTADAVYPSRALKLDELFFFSTLPHAFSTEAELLVRYGADGIDGVNTCIQRVHVTGGTNGILVKSIMRHRPFTPTFFGRAEDQAYILSVWPGEGEILGYAHEDGLIMRHDKEAFAQEAIKSASVGRAIGDYIRMLYFSEYVRVLTGGRTELIKSKIDPFTGCFVSQMPVTVSHLRFALKAVEVTNDSGWEGVEYVKDGARRMRNALNFIAGPDSALSRCYIQERDGWNLFYDLMLLTKKALSEKDEFAVSISKKAKDIFCSLKM